MPVLNEQERLAVTTDVEKHRKEADKMAKKKLLGIIAQHRTVSDLDDAVVKCDSK